MSPGRGVVSFDLDGTLIHGPFAAVLREVCAGISSDGLYRDVLRRHEELLLDDEYAAYGWSAMVASAALVRGIEVGERSVTARIAAGLTATSGGTRVLHPDTAEVLSGLRSAGWTVVILTNGRRAFQEPVIAGAGLLPVIDELITSDDARAAKPAQAAFEFARGSAGLHIHVGDRLDHDIAGASGSSALSLLLRADAPATGIVQDFSAGQRSALLEYLRVRHAAERRSDAAVVEGDLPHQMVPNAVATDLRAVLDLASALESADLLA